MCSSHPCVTQERPQSARVATRTIQTRQREAESACIGTYVAYMASQSMSPMNKGALTAPDTCRHFPSSLEYPKTSRTHRLLSHSAIHSTCLRTGHPGAPYALTGKMPQVLVKEMKEQAVGGTLKHRQEIWVFHFNLRQKCPLCIQLRGDRNIQGEKETKAVSGMSKSKSQSP